jgi:hypothetical protein
VPNSQRARSSQQERKSGAEKLPKNPPMAKTGTYLRDIILEALGNVGGLLTRCVGIELSSHGLNFHLELLLGSLVGSLEGHMLKEVSSSVVLVILIHGASIDENTDRCGLTETLLSGNAKLVGQSGDLCGGSIQHVLGELDFATLGRELLLRMHKTEETKKN